MYLFASASLGSLCSTHHYVHLPSHEYASSLPFVQIMSFTHLCLHSFCSTYVLFLLICVLFGLFTAPLFTCYFIHLCQRLMNPREPRETTRQVLHRAERPRRLHRESRLQPGQRCRAMQRERRRSRQILGRQDQGVLQRGQGPRRRIEPSMGSRRGDVNSGK